MHKNMWFQDSPPLLPLRGCCSSNAGDQKFSPGAMNALLVTSTKGGFVTFGVCLQHNLESYERILMKFPVNLIRFKRCSGFFAQSKGQGALIATDSWLLPLYYWYFLTRKVTFQVKQPLGRLDMNKHKVVWVFPDNMWGNELLDRGWCSLSRFLLKKTFL